MGTKRFGDRNPELRKKSCATSFRWYHKDVTASRKRVSIQAAKYKKEKPDMILAIQRRYQKKRVSRDPIYNLKRLFGGRIRTAIKNDSGGRGVKSALTTELLGCSASHARSYIEKKFLPGMSWDNHGRGKDKWHLDHVRPCASFDLSDFEQQRYCFHFTNLQPLWEPDNIEKGAKWPI